MNKNTNIVGTYDGYIVAPTTETYSFYIYGYSKYELTIDGDYYEGALSFDA